MTQEERYGTRDMTYSAWHRRRSTHRYVGIENAQLLAMIDVDCALYVEYDEDTKAPLAVIETARDVGQHKTATVVRNLARLASIEGWLVLYTPSESEMNPANNKCPDIESFRVQALAPVRWSEMKNMTPKQWAQELVAIRTRASESHDRKWDEQWKQLDKVKANKNGVV